MKSRNKTILSALSVAALAGSLLAGCGTGASSTQGTDPAPAASNNTAEAPKSKFPEKPIQLVVPYAAGGGTDITARTLANAVSKYLPNKGTVVVENKPGASGTIGLTGLTQAKPDGYMISMATIGNLSIQPNYGKTPYSFDSFEPILIANSVPHVLVVKADAPWKTIDEWFDYVKNNPNAFTYSTPGVGNTQHLNLEAVALKDNLKLKHVPYDGAAPAITALLGGHVKGAVVQVHEAKPQVDSGELRILANIGTTKSDAIPDAPLLAERGYTGYNAWTGIVAPKGTPKEVVTILHDAFKKALEDPEVIEDFKKIGISPAYSGPEDFKKIAEETYKSTGDVAKKIGLIK
ncbi:MULTISPECIES: Bug family tripartite tricarboxylate transporter substrate binding protein [Paenibacillus]|uniref:Tripartite tricarboxylate transporter family receptor n=1 Tax=Paenibacillus naphthalenovorans TaxID=162209 RepID=A0A0U2M0L4_9BACL|nr:MULTISPECIES: tripartite tricarboxylate transporter substrate binding protein [Paenibacillus]ALS20416.1 tripartite tricarboxylate transporter family receptor [Paenibacillus naphthalenovorans]NTZ18144.1 tripartite tricarboxylate transporter substrate binding protein [Paenibacillus sp. JMULE4]GCL72986.1 tripartite tricarboxylate transporter substrate binding protein [Paenibacillus naphthalenovorans]SDI70878.1 Tripartite-type tricarboxylate transporter, receptor component TctC [Paenibacillus na